MATPEDRAHAQRLKYDYERRLRVLESRKARQGDNVDPAVITEIEDLRLNVAMLEPLLEPEPAPEVAAVVRRHLADDYLFVFRQVVKVSERLTKVEQAQHAAQVERLSTHEAIADIQSQQAESERKRRMWQPIWLFLYGFIALAIILALLFGRVYL